MIYGGVSQQISLAHPPLHGEVAEEAEGVPGWARVAVVVYHRGAVAVRVDLHVLQTDIRFSICFGRKAFHTLDGLLNISLFQFQAVFPKPERVMSDRGIA